MEINEGHAKRILELLEYGLVSGVGEPEPGKMCVESLVCYALDLPHGDDPACVSSALRQLKINLNDRPWSSKKARAAGLRRLAVAQLGSRDHLDDKEFARRVAELAIRKSVPEALRAAASIHKDPKHIQALRDAANKCEREPTEANSLEAQKTSLAASAYAAAYAAAHAAHAAYASAAAAAYAAAADAYAAYASASAYAAAYAAAHAAYASAAAAAYAADADAASARDKSLADFAESVVQILIEMKAPGCQWLSLTEAA